MAASYLQDQQERKLKLRKDGEIERSMEREHTTNAHNPF